MKKTKINNKFPLIIIFKMKHLILYCLNQIEAIYTHFLLPDNKIII